ncbi:MAG: hypothetical protein P8N63_01320, partial [Pseudomonadales bacterium]|nr:hypothetical protein [Pseudomonadales bacterium]
NNFPVVVLASTILTLIRNQNDVAITQTLMHSRFGVRFSIFWTPSRFCTRLATSEFGIFLFFSQRASK